MWRKKVDSETTRDHTLDPRNYLEGWCANCGEPGYYTLHPDRWEEPHLVVCQSCGHEWLALWCPECGVGGNFVQDATSRPTEWRCETCGGTYVISPETYENPIPAHNEMTAPSPIRDWIGQTKQRYISGGASRESLSRANRIRWLVLAIFVAIVVFAVLVQLGVFARR